jgi:hypothetical protein
MAPAGTWVSAPIPQLGCLTPGSPRLMPASSSRKKLIPFRRGEQLGKSERGFQPFKIWLSWSLRMPRASRPMPKFVISGSATSAQCIAGLALPPGARNHHAPMPTVFDPVAYIADLRAAGYRLEWCPLRRHSSKGDFEAPESFVIHGKPGFRIDIEAIQAKWWPSRKSLPTAGRARAPRRGSKPSGGSDV